MGAEDFRVRIATRKSVEDVRAVVRGMHNVRAVRLGQRRLCEASFAWREGGHFVEVDMVPAGARAKVLVFFPCASLHPWTRHLPGSRYASLKKVNGDALRILEDLPPGLPADFLPGNLQGLPASLHVAIHEKRRPWKAELGSETAPISCAEARARFGFGGG